MLACLPGAKTAAHGFVTAALIGAVLLFATPVFGHLPLNALAAIVITGVLPLLDFGRVLSLARVGKPHLLHTLFSAVHAPATPSFLLRSPPTHAWVEATEKAAHVCPAR